MYISKVSIRNYRNFMNSTFEFTNETNTIIGENGSGKTNLFRALRLILDDNLYKYAYQLEAGDFNRNIGEWKGHWIIISVEFSELSNDEAIQSLFVHGAGNISGDTVDKATYNLFFRPKADIRKKLSELDEGDTDGLNSILDNITIEDYETKFTGKSTADFNNDDVYKELVGDFETVSFNFDIDEEKYGVQIPNQLSVSKEISFTFIKALRDVVSDFHNTRTNPLISLLTKQSQEINEDEFKPISEKVNDLNSSIEGLSDVQKIQKGIKDTIKEAVGETYSPSSLSIKSNLSEEADELLKSLRLFIGEPNEDYEGAIHEMSLGGANLIYLTLKLLEYKYSSSGDTLANFLLIEEPEAHIHTHIQKSLFDKIEFSETQIIYSTHSTHISEASKISSMNILSKKKNHAEVFQPSKNLDPELIPKIERYLDAVRSNLLFAKNVILVEGDAEEILVPILIKQVIGKSLDELGISLINIRSTGFKNIADLFHDDRIRRNCSIITDLDKSINGETSEAEIKGNKRKEELDDYSDGNQWIKPFYAEYTFEVDFIKEGNAHECVKLLPEIYTQEKTIEKAKEELKSKKVEDFGSRVLTMANNVGKGWFATILGRYVTFQTIIPRYILDALFFANPFSENNISELVDYRLACIERNDETDLSEMRDKIDSILRSDLSNYSKVKDFTDVYSKEDLEELIEGWG